MELKYYLLIHLLHVQSNNYPHNNSHGIVRNFFSSFFTSNFFSSFFSSFVCIVFVSLSSERKLINKSEKKFFKKKENRVSPFENKHLKYRKQSDKNIIKNNNNNLRKEKLSPFTSRQNQMSHLDKKR